jgi:magnesium transporter
MVHWNLVLETEQLSIFLGRKFVLTFQERPGDCFEVVRERIRKSHGRLRVAGADYLAYALLDAVIDSYFPVADAIGDRLETLDEQLARERGLNAFRAIHELRGDLMVLRRAIRPLRDALIKLMPDPGELFSKTTQLYLRDCYDHTVQLMDVVDTYRELCSDLRDFNLSLVSNRMNDVMKVLTVIATIFIPLSFIAGVYGMNFDTTSPWNMPELSWRYGYPAALLLMAGVAGGMLWYFQWRGWLGGAADGELSGAPVERGQGERAERGEEGGES